jgi:hypothetical protein
MRVTVGVLAAVSVVAASMAAQATAAGAASAPCLPKVTTIAGKHAVVNCGPAVVTIHLGGKSYTFKGGLCSASSTAKAALQLDAGTLVVGAKGNAGKPYISFLIATNHAIASVFEADYGGKQLFGDTLIKVAGKIPLKGTFTSAFGPHFTGAWDCHGVVDRTP